MEEAQVLFSGQTSWQVGSAPPEILARGTKVPRCKTSPLLFRISTCPRQHSPIPSKHPELPHSPCHRVHITLLCLTKPLWEPDVVATQGVCQSACCCLCSFAQLPVVFSVHLLWTLMCFSTARKGIQPCETWLENTQPFEQPLSCTL